MRLGLALISFVTFSFTVLAQQPVHAYDSIRTLNSSYDEKGPVLIPDGTTLYFTIANHPGNIGGKKDPGDIWVSHLNPDNSWSAPVHGGTLINDRGYNGVAGISADGRQLFLLNHFASSGAVAKTQGLSVAQRAGTGWGKPENISIPYFHNKSITYGYVAYDLSVFIFSAESYNTRGVEDIYVCTRDRDGTWSAPKNLGNTINSKFQELSPSLSPDGRTLYFSSNGRQGGAGSFDIYQSTRLDDSWTSWSTPVSMGTAINTEGREIFFRLIPQVGMALYVSTTNSDGYGDLRVYAPQDPIIEPVVVADTATQPLLVMVAPQPPITEEGNVVENDHQLHVYGKVISAGTNEPLNARITFTADAEPVAVQADQQGFTASLLPGRVYTVQIEAVGYVSKIVPLAMDTLRTGAFETNYTLQPIEAGTVVNLNSVLFEQSSTELLPESYPELNMVVSFLRENPQVEIELAGHTDNRGNARDNIRLSQERADRVKDYLVEKGIDTDRVVVKGYGGEKPVASNDTEETRRLNRRVEFIIKKM